MRIKRKNIFESLSILFSNKIWTFDPTGYSPGFLKLLHFVKLVRVTLDSFFEYRMGFQCVALSYYVALAIIPMSVCILAISGGVGLSNKISEIIQHLIPNYPEVTTTLINKANELLSVAQNGGVGIISAIFFLWTIFWMMFQIERVFNNVWGIRKIPRKIYTRISSYIILLILIPFIMLLFGTGIVFYSNITNLIGLDMSNFLEFSKFMGYSAFYFLATIALSLMYKFIPAERVKYKYAFISALFAGFIFTVFQYFYLESQMFVARLNAVYGVIAAIPFFLMWLNFSWQIIILGAQLCYGMHNVNSYKSLSSNQL